MKSHVQAVLLVCWWNHAKVLSNIIVNKWRQISHTNSQILRVQTILCCLLRWNLCHHWIGLSAAFTPRSKKWFIYFGKSTQLIGQTLKCLFLNNCNYNFLNYCYHDNHFIFFTLQFYLPLHSIHTSPGRCFCQLQSLQRLFICNANVWKFFVQSICTGKVLNPV